MELDEDDNGWETDSASDDDDDQAIKVIDNAVIATPPTNKTLQERHKLEFTVIIFGGAMLAFNAGFVNGTTYQFGGYPVSHVTGTTTHAGMDFTNGDFDKFLINIALVVCFVFGSAITGSIMQHDSFHLGYSYGPLFVIGSFLFLLACICSFIFPESELYYYFAAMACGLQNSLTTRYSGSIIRTTHMTGAATDIGLTLGRLAMGEHKEAWKLQVLVPLYCSFLVGGGVSVLAFRLFKNLTLLINVFFFLIIGLAYSLVVGTQLHIPMWKALFGLYSVVEHRLKRAHSVVKKVSRHVKIHNPLHRHTPSRSYRRRQAPSSNKQSIV